MPRRIPMMLMRVLLLCWSALAYNHPDYHAPEYRAEPMKLTQSNFHAITLQPGKSAFVRFMAPWCGFCKKNQPDWYAVAKTYEKSPNVIIGEVDCVEDRPLCQEYDVKEYPKWIVCNKKQNGKCKPYEDTLMDVYSLHDYVREQLKGKFLPCDPKTREGCSKAELKIFDELSGKKAEDLQEEISQLDKKINGKEVLKSDVRKKLKERRKALKTFFDHLESKAMDERDEF
mmetsp:Transcript_124483/g.215096  ORF Transcript_124483/g.215096 Transcript_124483/m.215096 type:complete len:229 (+) Transcript_124483:72-758(+)